MKLLITGGAGFIGSNLVKLALSQEYEVVTLDKLTYAGNLASLASVMDDPSHRFVQGDICDGALLGRVLAGHRVSAVLNLAAESHVDRSIDGPKDFIETNLVGTFTLLEAARRYRATLSEGDAATFRFLHVSTDEVFGALGPTGVFDEDTPYDPRSPYSASKAGSDHLVRAWGHTYGLPVLITNCSNNYGPCQFPEKLIPHMIITALAERPLPIYGDGGNIRDWLYVGDHCEAILAVLRRAKPGDTYVIGGRSERTNLQIVHKICDLLDELRPRANGESYRALISFVKDRPGHDFRYAIDPSKLKADLGWEPLCPFEQGMRDTVNWYLENEDWIQGILSGAYRLARIGTGDANDARA